MMICWLIDDNEIDLLITRKLMQTWEPSLSIEEFTDGREVLTRLNQPGVEPPHFIFLDLFMPKFSGWKFLEEYQTIDNKGALIYVLSSSVDQFDIDRVRGYQGVQGYISKPVTEESVRRAIAAYQQQLIEN
ncbi:response regulator [Tunicatimonas pelagia]|uniref:response regulator n=1 Tax=Tunicatimonas pelagia TaxID=931531 RepID=UPI002666929B|nr:response regulator [Tunicatimonas pelagia]WKN46208.1 response regulator [Tunicatimonas pelagia]